MGRLTYIELDNFKSYSGQHVIGPFADFTAIIGPNGSGKSNLMDAISFVFGVQSKQLRSANLKDLIFKLDATDHIRRKASVSILYELDDDDHMTDISAGDSIRFTRIISSAGASSYRLDDKEVSWELYENMLTSIGVIVKARNFLVFQGDVDSISHKSPAELTQLMEQISGSGNLKEEFDRLREQLKSCENDLSLKFQQRKGLSAEYKHIQEQKSEADEWLDSNKQLKACQTELLLIDANQLQEKMTETMTARLSAESDRQDQSELTESMVRERHEIKASITTCKRDVRVNETLKVSADKFVNEAKSKLSQLSRDKSSVTLKMDTLTDGSKKINAEVDNDDSKCNDIRLEMANNDNQEALLLSQYSALVSKFSLQSATLETMMDEYSVIKMALNSTCRNDKQAMISIKHKIDSYVASIADARDGIEALKRDMGRSGDADGRLNDNISGLHTMIDQFHQERVSKQEEREVLSNQIEEASEGIGRVQSLLSSSKDELLKLEMNSQSNQLEQERVMMIASLKSSIPGIKGRLCDLISPTHKRYETAIDAIIGRYNDAIVVDNHATVHEVLNRSSSTSMIFIPAKDVKYPAIQERLRSLGSNCRLCFDVINIDNDDENIRTAVQYAVGNSVIVDSMDDAIDLVYKQRERVKVVTLDGDVIHANGFMSSSTATPHRSHTSSKKIKAVNDIKAEIQSLSRQYDDLLTVLSSKNRLMDLESFEVNSRQKIELMRDQMSLAQNKLTGSRSNAIRKELSLKDDFVVATKAMLVAAEQELTVVQSRIKTVKDNLFADLCVKYHVESIDELESGCMSNMQSLQDELQGIRVKRSQLSSQLEDLTAGITKRRSDVAEGKIKLKDLSKAMTKITNAMNANEAELKELSERSLNSDDSIATNKAKLKNLEDKLSDLDRQKSATAQSISSTSTVLTALDMKLERLRTELHDVLSRSREDDLTLQLIRENDDDDDDAESAHFSQTQNIIVQSEWKKLFNIDTSSVKKKNRRRSKDADADVTGYDNRRKELVTDIARIALTLSSSNVNLKAAETLKSLRTSLLAVNKLVDESRGQLKQVNKQFEDTKKARRNLFMACYHHVSASLSTIYGQLATSKHVGGNASLVLDHPIDPYEGGIKYHIMPPFKRYRELDQLSGGEATMASLALLFALFSFKKAPFFVLDEIDAALDNANVTLLKNFILRQKNVQIVCISLKDALFQQADTLVGVCKDQDSSSSRVILLDLKSFTA